LYVGNQRDRHAEVLFASVQTLSRENHLRHFEPSQFDYIVIDEFHHASAPTYRRLIDHFDPQFLLGLTATPERTDGGDLLALCGENLVYRCDLIEGINRALLSPFHYFGVPDEVDYTNIPWRSSRFDPEQLELAVATERRAENAFEQWQKRRRRAPSPSACRSATRTSCGTTSRRAASGASRSTPDATRRRERLAAATRGRRAGRRVRRRHVQ
jgi:superfamily II DNA or RNA helicase